MEGHATPLTENDAEAAFVAYLTAQGWAVSTTNADFTDIVAARDDEILVAEVKRHTKSAGAAIDIGYGQLLRRIDLSASNRRHALVVPASLRWHAERVPTTVRERLGIELFLVDENWAVTQA